ncbi:MAG: CotS family spore coat protein [Lachnospiraceae bacterium]
MEEKNVDLLAQYELNIYRTSRVKGAYLLETAQGLKLFGSCQMSEGKAEFEQKVKLSLKTAGFCNTDCYVRTKDGTILVSGPYGETFLMRDWFEGEECNVRRPEQVLAAVRTLARLHLCFGPVELTEAERTFCLQPKVPELLERRNKELRRVRTYIRDKKQKSSFESMYLSQFPKLYEQAEEAVAMLEKEKYLDYYNKAVAEGQMFHGNFTHHSVLMLPGGETAVINFEKAGLGIRIHDFYLFFRKLMEKCDWDACFGYEMLNAYEAVRPIPKEEQELLLVLLWYPEKFWKIANHYYNNRKSWIPQKNMQKLMLTMEQAEKKQECLKELFAKE